MKDNFLLKKSQIEIFENLSDEEAGKLIKGIFNYVCNGESNLNGLLNVVFIPIKNEIDKNESKYKAICERNKANGSNGGRPKKNEENEEKQEEPKETENNPLGYFGENTHISYINNHNSYNQNSDLEEKGYGEEEPLNPPIAKETDDNSLLLEISKQVIEYLNLKTNSSYRYNTKATKEKISARLREKFTLDDFKKVIDNKVAEWTGTEFEKYLSPDTLFGTKFEKYLNQKINPKQSSNGNKKDKTMEVLRNVFNGTTKIGQ